MDYLAITMCVIVLALIGLFIWGSEGWGRAQYYEQSNKELLATRDQLTDLITDQSAANHEIVTRLSVARALGPEALKKEVNEILEILILNPRTTDGELNHG